MTRSAPRSSTRPPAENSLPPGVTTLRDTIDVLLPLLLTPWPAEAVTVGEWTGRALDAAGGDED